MMLMKGKTSKHRALAWILTLAMVVSMAPATVFAEEIPGATGCTHVHDGSCGYVEAVAEVPCDRGCTDMDGDGVTDHADDCAYTPAVEGQPCMHVHDESCGGLTAEAEVQEPSGEEVGGEQPGEAEPGTTESGETDPEEGEPEQIELPEAISALQKRIDALPTGDAYRAMSEDEQEAVYVLAAEIAEEYAELSEEDQAKLDITRMEELFAVMNEDVELYDTAMPGARSEYNSNTGDVFLGGNYIEVGISKHGSFGTSTCPQTDQNWHPHASASGLGLTSDGDGWDVGEAPVTGDFFLPGSPEERWGLAYKLDDTAYQYLVADRNGVFTGSWSVQPTVQDASDIPNGQLKAVITGKTTHGVEITITYSFGVNDKFYTTKVDIVNKSGKELTDVRFMRSFDPDQDQQTQRTYNTYNKVICNPVIGKAGGSDNFSMVVARGAKTLAGFFFLAFDNRARASRGVDFAPSSLYLPGLWDSAPVTTLTYADEEGIALTSEMVSASNTNGYIGEDNAIALTFQIGTLANGVSDSLEYSSSLDPNVEEALSAILNASVNYEKDTLTGLEAGVTYSITAGESTYTVIADANGEIPLSGTDIDGNTYDFAGQTLTIAKQGSEDTPAEIEVAGRPDAPEKPSDLEDESTPSLDANIEIVELTPTSVTIAPKEGQQYAYSTDGTNWITLTSLDGSGNYVIDGLTDGSAVKIRTRVPATNERPASQWSAVTEIQLKSTVRASATGWSGVYDGTAHSISVNVTSPAAGATITYCSSADGNYNADQPVFTDVGEYTVYYRVTAEGHYPTYGSDTVTIDRKEVALEWGNRELTYNGTVQTPVATAGSLCGEDTCTVTVNGGQNNVGTGYTATATGVSNSNYKLPETGRTTTFSIVPKEIAINWGSTQLTYNGTEQKPTAAPIGVVNGDDCGLTVSGAQTAVGTHTATAALSNANYKIKTGDEQTSFKIHPKTITADMISLDAVDGKYALKNAPITPVVTVKDGSNTLVHGETGDYILSGDTEKTAYGTYTITVTGTGNYTGSQNVSWYITEKNAPTGEIILQENRWNSFLNDITFGLFFKNTQQVTVNATDGVNESGVDQVFYYVSDTNFSNSDSLAGAKWTEISNGGSFNINPNSKVYVYVKITDKAGNVAYISSKGIVVYTDAAQDTDEITFTRTSTEDVTASVTLNGNTISKVANGTTELTNGTHYTISADGTTITFKASYLQTLSAGDYTIKVSYKPMGVNYVDAEGNDQPVDTSIALSVKRVSAEDADTKITNQHKLSKEYDGHPTEAATSSSKNGSTPKVEYKKKGDSDSSYTEEVPKDAGEYVVRVTYPQDENYEETTATEEFTISPKAVTAAVTVAGKAYDGTTAAEVTATVDTGIAGQNLTITGLTGNFDNKNAGTGKTVTVNSADAVVTGGTGTYAGNYKVTYPTTATADITAKTLNAVVSAADKVYDGTTEAQVTATVETGITGETLAITGLTGSFADQNVGINKNVSIDSTGASVQAGAGTSAENYTVVYPLTAAASITARPVTLTWSNTELTYTGSEQEVTATVSNKASDTDHFTLTYTGNKQTAVGAYTAEVTGLGNDNYTLTEATGVTQKWKISYLETDAKVTPGGDAQNASGWYTGTVTLTPDSGYQISKDGVTWSDTLTVTDDGEFIVTYYLKDSNGSITDQKIITIKKDGTAPAGEIKVGENSFKEFLNAITFGYFFKNTVDVAISGTDSTSGIETFEYQKVAKGETYNADGTWTQGEHFSVSANEKLVVYAKIADKAGNVTIINSDGVVVYQDATEQALITYEKTTKTDKRTDDTFTLNGNTVAAVKNGDKSLTAGTDYEVSQNTIIFKGVYLDTLEVGTYTLTVAYDPMGEAYTQGSSKGEAPAESEISLKVVRHEGRVSIDQNYSGKTYDGKAVEAPSYEADSTGTATIEYKKADQTDDSYTLNAPKAAGDYVVRVTVAEDANYAKASATKSFKISPKEISVKWDQKTQFTYNGALQAPTAALEGVLEGDDCPVTVTGAQEDAGENYVATAEIDNRNYQIKKETEKQEFKIYQKKLTVAMVDAKTSYVYSGSDVTPELIVKDGEKTLLEGIDYTLSGDTTGTDVKNDYELSVEGQGNYTGTVKVTYKITDSAPPTGTIRVAKNEWKSLIHTLTFGIFYKARQTVTITASDEGSGVAAVSYFLTSNDTLMDQEALAALPDIKWTKFATANGGSFVINPDKKYVIYAKITDQSGNVTFISSNGIVLDQTAPEIKGIANGKTYCSDVTFTVSDSIGLASVKIDGVDHGTGGSYSIASGSEKETHTIEAADTAGNKTKYTVTINASGTHSFDSKWTEEKPATCTEKGIRSHKCSSCGFVEMQEIAELGHSYEMKAENVHFVWEGKKDDGSITEDHVKAYFICQNDSDHIKLADSCSVTSKTTTPATVSSAGKIIYTAKAAFGKNEYTATKTVILEKLQKLDVDAATDANSNIYTSTSVADGAPATSIDEGLDLELAKKLMTAAEEANYNDTSVATDVTVYLEVQNITGAVPAADTQKVQSEITDLITQKVNADANVEVEAKAGDTTYLDLSMYKNVTTKEDDVVTSDTTTQITDTEKDIKITVTIPAGLPDVAAGFNRVFHIIRVHDGIAEILPTDRNGNSLTFWTSKFSTYAISYVDVKETPVPSSAGGGSVAVPVTKITVSSDSEKTTLTKAGETLQLTVQITPANATNKKVTWSSSDPKVATVDENGKVTAVGDGTVTITAKTGNGRTATFTITVKIKPEKEDGKDDDAGNTGGSSGKITLDTTYRKLALRASASTKTTNVLKWNKVADADGYVIYGNRCNSKGKTYQMVKQAVIKDNATTTWTDKALTSGTYYKYYIKAYKLVNGKKVWLSKSKVVHTTTAGGKFGNAKSLKVNKTTVSLAKGKTFAIKAEQILKKLPIQKHASIKYESSNSKIASVTRKGVIKAKKKGICYIYVYAQNGKYRRIKVTVK